VRGVSSFKLPETVVVDPEIPASILPLASTLRNGVPDISETVKISPVRSSVISNNLPLFPSTAKTVVFAVDPEP
jgi:hypothetical protein